MYKILKDMFQNIKTINYMFLIFSLSYIFVSLNMETFVMIFGENTLVYMIIPFIVYFGVLFFYDVVFLYLSWKKEKIYKKMQIDISNKILLYVLYSIFYIGFSILDINIINKYYYDNMFLLKYIMLIIGFVYIALFIKHKIQLVIFKKTSYSILIILVINIYVINGNLINILKPTIEKINQYLQNGSGNYILNIDNIIQQNIKKEQ